VAFIGSFFARLARGTKNYASQLSAFQFNARLYLLSAVMMAIATGVYRLLFNFYVLSQGYDKSLLGNLTTASSLTILLVALPMGYVADKLGRKRSLLIGSTITAATILLMVLFPSAPTFIVFNIFMGIAQALASVTMGPFLMENSTPKERVYLFSFSSGLQTAASSIGNWVGGYMPAWMGEAHGVGATSTLAYGSALLVVVAGAALAVVPLFFMRNVNLSREQRTSFAPLSYFRGHSGPLMRMVLPMLVTSIGAGMIMPFMNVFFREAYHQSDAAIGSMFAWGSLAMGLGLMIAPPLADRFGKIQLVVTSQAMSIPFLVLLGFSPWFPLSAAAYYIRVALMNMSSPVYQTFVMEASDPTERATVASLVSMANQFGWAVSPSISGALQDSYGFSPAFMVTIVLYTFSTFLYWKFHWKTQRVKPVPVAAE